MTPPNGSVPLIAPTVVRTVVPTDAVSVTALVATGRYVCGRHGDMTAGVRGARLKSPTDGILVAANGPDVLAAVAVRVSGRLTPVVHMTISVGARADPAAVVRAATAALVHKFRTDRQCGWLAADAADADPTVNDVMTAAGWLSTQTVSPTGLRRYLYPVGASREPQVPKGAGP
jgi:hypothetical protein